MPTTKKINANGTVLLNFKPIEFDGFRNKFVPLQQNIRNHVL